MTITEAKQHLRSKLRKQRRDIPEQERALLDEGILQNCRAFSWYQEADTLLLYVSMGGEPETRGIIADALRSGKCVALPRCSAAGEMEFFCIRTMEDLRPGAYNIPEPTGDRIPDLTQRTLCLVPGVAFSQNGQRLGQGGGYYDRYLEQHPQLRTAGICYTCLMQESIPCETHDRRVDAVITERSVEVCDVIKI